MPLSTLAPAAALQGGPRFDAFIDARSPSEFAEDHLPGALNWPVLDDTERAEVGTLYVQDSAFVARKRGAVLVARNIAALLEQHVAGLTRDWQPLVYCWRGGQRSGSLAGVLSQVGFRVVQLEGGYKAFRALVRQQLASLPAALHWQVLCGRTGSGKSRLLEALQAAGHQVLDLERLAAHRGSILGDMPDRPQPSQKRFDTLIWHALRGFDPSRPVFVESESARIGRLRVPPALLERMHGHGRAWRVEMDEAARIELLLADYAGLTSDGVAFALRLEALVPLCGRERVSHWQSQARTGDWRAVVSGLMREHYDPLYERSMRRSYAALADAPRLQLGDASPQALQPALAMLASSPPP